MPEVSPNGKPRRSLSRFVGGMALGAAVMLALSIVILVVVYRDRTPELTHEALAAAEARWRAHGPESYDLDLELSGRGEGRIHLEVRRGEVTRYTLDGRTPEQRRTWRYWTVESQFDVIRTELAGVADPAGVFGAPEGAEVLVRARFDPELGYPTSYRRYVLGTPLEIGWDVTRFEPVGGSR